MERKKVLIACGGSAGHIFPGIALAEELKKRRGNEIEISFLTSGNRLARSLFRNSGLNFYALPAGLKRDTVSSTNFISGLIRALLESAKIVFAIRPDCFVGLGTYIAAIPFFMASLLRVPTIIHEQNAVMGKANNLMRHFADRVAFGFPDKSVKNEKKIVFTGNPLRKSAAKIHEKARARGFLGLKHDRFTVLAIGGSQGSRAINSCMAEALSNMKKETRRRIQIIHLSGERDYTRLKKAYKKINVFYRVYPFFSDMGIVYSAADIAVSRAGASAVCELCSHKIPSILIPYPFAGRHQLKNAEFLTKKNAAVLIEEKKLSGASLMKEMIRLIDGQEYRKSISVNMCSIAASDAAKRLADEVASLL